MSDAISQIVDSVEGGVAKNLDELCRDVLGLDGTDDLTDEQRAELDEELFTCESCNWTMPRGDCESESEPETCKECHEEEQ